MPIRSNGIKNGLFGKGAAFAAAALLSRVLGFFRDAAVVWIFGAGWVSDAFFAAFRVANFVRRTIGEGALNAAFMPALAAEKARGGKGFFGAAFGWLLWGSLAISAALFLLAKPVVLLTAFGLSSRPEAFSLAVSLSRIMCWQVVPVLLSALCQGVVYHYGKLFSAAAAPVLFSVFALGWLVAVRFGAANNSHVAVMGLAAAGVLGAVAGLFILIKLARGFGERPSVSLVRSPEAGAALLAALPALVCSTADQITMFTDMMLASFLPAGSITAVYNATRLMQFPLVLVGVSAATAALTAMSRAGAGGDRESVRKVLSLASASALFLLLPAAAGLMAFSREICVVLFRHGQFTAEAADVTSRALFYCALGLPAYGVSKIMVMAFYSLSDWKLPLKVTMLQVALDISLAMLLMGGMGVAGLALAGAVSAWAGVFMLAAMLSRCGAYAVGEWLSCLLRCGACAAAMYAVCAGLGHFMYGHAAVTLAVGTVVGAAFYFALSLAFNLPELRMLREGE